jgi:ring-1,2-phenylacetyl-CoA epoxidase subunit PaaD
MSITIDQAWDALRGVPDPEVPALSVVDLGIIRAIEPIANGLRVDVTPTYSGCPALDVIEREIGRALETAGAPRATLLLNGFERNLSTTVSNVGTPTRSPEID